MFEYIKVRIISIEHSNHKHKKKARCLVIVENKKGRRDYTAVTNSDTNTFYTKLSN